MTSFTRYSARAGDAWLRYTRAHTLGPGRPLVIFSSAPTHTPFPFDTRFRPVKAVRL